MEEIDEPRDLAFWSLVVFFLWRVLGPEPSLQANFAFFKIRRQEAQVVFVIPP